MLKIDFDRCSDFYKYLYFLYKKSVFIDFVYTLEIIC